MAEGPILCFLLCCKSKSPSGRIEGLRGISREDLPATWSLLMKAREGMRSCINPDSPPTSAIHLYTGSLYKALDKEALIGKIKAGRLRLIILSAAYGIVDALESIKEYEAVMKGKTADYWRSLGLDSILCDYIINANPEKVVGFFSGEAAWKAPGAKYRYFFMEGLRRARAREREKEKGEEKEKEKEEEKGLKAGLSGCFYRQKGLGTTAILGALGRAFMDFMKNDFSDSFVTDARQRGIVYDGIRIGFDEV